MRTLRSLLWVREHDGIWRVWTTPAAAPAGEIGREELHFARVDWSEIGSISVPAGLQIEYVGERELETLLLRAVTTAGPRA